MKQFDKEKQKKLIEQPEYCTNKMFMFDYQLPKWLKFQ
jgi:hypothetical protein